MPFNPSGNLIPQFSAEMQFLQYPQFSDADWLEAVNLYSPTQLSIGRKTSHATLTGYIPFSKIQAAIIYFLGFSWIDDRLNLRRELPAVHPILPALAATSITECVGVKFIVKANSGFENALPYATYHLARITVAFSQPSYEMIPDYDIDYDNYDGTALGRLSTGYPQELRRFTSWTPKPYVDLLEAPAGALVFDAPGAAWDGNQILSPRGLVRGEKSTLKLIWWNVPYDFVTNKFGFMPKMMSKIGKISVDMFFGEVAHTWLFDDVDCADSQVYADPIASTVFSTLTKRIDVIFTFRYTNPPNGVLGSTEAGWRLWPAWDGFYYPTRLANDNTEFLPQDTSLSALFTHWNA